MHTYSNLSDILVKRMGESVKDVGICGLRIQLFSFHPGRESSARNPWQQKISSRGNFVVSHDVLPSNLLSCDAHENCISTVGMQVPNSPRNSSGDRENQAAHRAQVSDDRSFEEEPVSLSHWPDRQSCCCVTLSLTVQKLVRLQADRHSVCCVIQVPDWVARFPKPEDAWNCQTPNKAADLLFCCRTGMWSDMKFTHLKRLGDLPHKVVKDLMWCRATVKIVRHSLCHLRVGDWQAPLTGDLEQFPHYILPKKA